MLNKTTNNTNEITEIMAEITKTYQELRNENKENKFRIRYLENRYLEKQPRIKYQERYVIYILTTKLLKSERRYILGKATNLTKRLSTYNKTDEHEVIYYHKCKDKKTMKIVEIMVLKKLEKYRERANRERFILPEEKDIGLFVNVIKECVSFIG